jgi:hypothetical protein
MTFFEEVNNLIKKQREEYKTYPKNIVINYTKENGLKDDYEGRQVLEMLQNAEDAGSSEVLLKLNKEEKCFIVANKGKEVFSAEGIESLMNANYSPKPKAKYIGNKGLGFRSILNWADEIHIIANNCEIKFSKDIVAKEFEKLNLTTEEKSKLLAKARLSQGQIPMAILSIPEINELKEYNSEWLTIIKIYYKEGQEISIEKQLKEFSPEVLLFLKNIKSIAVEGISEPVIHKILPTETEGKYIIGKNNWELSKPDKENEGILPSEFQNEGSDDVLHYNVQLAFKDGFVIDNYKLHNYFPTELSVNLPCLLHGTFDLDASRNHSKLTPRNEYILNKLVDLIKRTALDLCKRDKGWSAYLLLTSKSTNPDSALITALYQKLEELKKILEIFPTIEGQYCSLSNAIFYGNDFSGWIQQNNFGEYTPNLLQPPSPEINLLISHFSNKYSKEQFLEIISSISGKIVDIDERVTLIQLLCSDELKQYKDTHYPLLLDTQGILIPIEKQVFTLERGSVDKYLIPDLTKLTFINNELYVKLIEQFSEKINEIRIKDEHKSRPLKRLLDSIINIASNDILDVVKNLVSSANDYIDKYEFSDKSLSKDEVINKTLSSLYIIFREDESREGVLKSPILLFNKNNEIKKCNDLFLGTGFTSGQITEDIFEGIYLPNNYLNSSYSELFKAEDSDALTLESFFLWLGVNKHIKFKTIEAPKEQAINRDYINYVYEKLEIEEFHNKGYLFKGFAFENPEDSIAKLTNEKLILLIIKEIIIKQQLDYFSTQDSLKYSFHYWYEINPKPSYLTYQISKYFNFEDFLIDNGNISFINKTFINYDDPVFKKNNINEQDINQALILLGAKTSFSDLRPDHIYEILHNYESKEKDGKTTQTLYRMALNTLEKNNYEPTAEQVKGIRVFAKSGNNKIGQWEEGSKVYYSNNIVLPASIIQDELILNVPKRFGEDKVKKYLGVKLFSEFELDLIESSVAGIETLTEELLNELERLQPFFLSYRLKDITNEKGKKDAADQLKNYSINLIKEGKYSTKDKTEVALQFNEFIRKGNDFFLCIKDEQSLISLKSNNRFCDAITEILCLVCKVWDHRDQFRIAFKYGIKELQHQFETTGEDETLIAAKELLGIAPLEIAFWEAIYKTQNIAFDKEITNEKLLKEKINTDLNITLDLNYKMINFLRFNNKESVEFLRNLCSNVVSPISLIELNKAYNDFKGLFEWHSKQLLIEADSIKSKFDYALWAKFSIENMSKQMSFKTELDRYDKFIGSQKWEMVDPFSFDCNYENILNDLLEKEFGVSLKLEFPNDISIKNKYYQLLLDSNVNEVDIQLQERSLLYFDGNESEIKNIIQKYKVKEASEVEVETPFDPNDVDVKSGILNDISGPSFLIPPDDILSLPKTYGSADEKGKKQAGKKAEKMVIDWLRKTYKAENVQWISGYNGEARKNDKAGYDAKYRKSKDSEFIYLEIKSYSGNSFIISANEISKGFSAPEKYHIALVKDKSIFIVEDYFLNEKRKEEFEILNSNNSVKPLDFVIYFKLSDKELECK